jgi:hypothetical protein
MTISSLKKRKEKKKKKKETNKNPKKTIHVFNDSIAKELHND